MQLILNTAATVQPVTKAEVKSNSRLIEGTTEDTLLDQLIAAATDYTERALGRALVSQTWDLYLDAFPPSDKHMLEVPRPPLISVTHIKYWDLNDVEQTWDSSKYVVDTDREYKAVIYPAINESWPSPRVFPKAVNVRYVAGYADSGASPPVLADNVPEAIKQAIMMLVGHLYENREASAPIEVRTVPLGYDALINQYKVFAF